MKKELHGAVAGRHRIDHLWFRCGESSGLKYVAGFLPAHFRRAKLVVAAGRSAAVVLRRDSGLASFWQV